MVDWWNMQPWWVKKIRLFLAIVWREHYDERMSAGLAWEVAGCMHYRKVSK